ncbi:hypothetical protein A3715_32875 [Oleiphilus sp. HI0009]|uniref:hypothetical protein n=1 Tax=unclassified Oleiphilus TaxID=2631174 RepID=UPI0007C2E863|nr:MULTISPECIES: hypothetical protein [unclassified Oleiphilus]KZX78796.1 hypothetical protein A3715_01325 [Oleiphilus sp. HI0009]KZX82977.1 hypothetical protein A3715_32875 [Oleiphilus sp. HI0009]KZY63408.1 hypothetical protein A3738_11965 [Oleiphilus sp. HI0066]KZY69808.1 hypothetical protein A3738_25420 [Oleiphilus sp. HI0066]KZY72152.1 hypothetical protein A3739_03290 [Oleiphilus sp. HI0067]
MSACILIYVAHEIVPIDLVAVIMGHTNSETTKKHYAKIVPEDRPNVAIIISGIAGFEYKQE